jgi:hypothetical protein
MSSFQPPLGSASESSQELQQQIEQSRLQQAELNNQLQMQLLQQSRGPSAFRKVLGAVAGVSAGILAPGLGSAIGSMIMGSGNNSNAVANLMAMNALNAQQAASSRQGYTTPPGLSDPMAESDAKMQKMMQDHMNQIQKEWTEMENLPKLPDQVAFLALQEKVSNESAIFQATSAIAKAKHQAAMAAIQNIKD